MTYCWRTSFHAIQPRWLRWILQVLVPSTTVYVRHNVRRFGVGQQYPCLQMIIHQGNTELAYAIAPMYRESRLASLPMPVVTPLRQKRTSVCPLASRGRRPDSPRRVSSTRSTATSRHHARDERRVRSRGLPRNRDLTGTSHWMRRRKIGEGHTRCESGLPQQGIPGRLIHAMRRLLLAARAGDDGLPKLNHRPSLFACPMLERVKPLPLLAPKATKRRNHTAPPLR
jgi:hypothetical protein